MLGTIALEHGRSVLVRATEPLRVFCDLVERDPLLAGVLVEADACEPVMLSRGMVHRALTAGFGRELFLTKPIARLLSVHPPRVTRLSASTPIGDAITIALSRQGQELYEPVVVELGPTLSVLDIRWILVSQCDELYRTIAQAEQDRAAAVTANESKSSFLANMSHEIRTPMSAILGFTEVLLNTELDEHTRRSHLETIRRNGSHLMHLLNDVLDISKIQAGKLSVDPVPTDIITVFEDAVATARPLATSKGVVLESSITFPFPRSVRTDPTRVRQIFINLVNNAVKFTDDGRISMRLALVQGDDEKPMVRFSISDTGIGMDSDALARLFKPFSQGDNSMSRRFGGTGLGLSISRSLALALGGDLTVTSTPGEGSTFVCELSAGERAAQSLWTSSQERSAAAQVAPRTSAAPTLIGSPRILLADDGLDNRRLISFLLSKAGARVEMAENGREAFDKAIAASASGKPFELVFMDMQMPELDGYEATTLLRDRGYSVPVIALTAHAMTGDRERCLAAGCNDYLTKPADRATLVEMARKWIGVAIPSGVPQSLPLRSDVADTRESPVVQASAQAA